MWILENLVFGTRSTIKDYKPAYNISLWRYGKDLGDFKKE
jgi:hypothetical protein